MSMWGAAVLGCMLEQENLVEWFDDYANSPYFVGVRSAPVGPPEQWMENSASQRGLKELEDRDLCLDLLIGYEALPRRGTNRRPLPQPAHDP